MLLVYFSNVSENTHKFVQKLPNGDKALRIPIRRTEEMPVVDEPYVLITPTYGNGAATKVVPHQVVQFLNKNHQFIRGVVAGGNTNFGKYFAVAGDIIAAKCKVPVLDRFELLGTPHDVERISQRLEAFCPQ